MNHYIPNQRDIKAAHDAGLNDRQIINLCKCDSKGLFLNHTIENPPPNNRKSHRKLEQFKDY